MPTDSTPVVDCEFENIRNDTCGGSFQVAFTSNVLFAEFPFSTLLP